MPKNAKEDKEPQNDRRFERFHSGAVAETGLTIKSIAEILNQSRPQSPVKVLAIA
jgi:hypothetical protein